jgi:hypothetical protein
MYKEVVQGQSQIRSESTIGNKHRKSRETSFAAWGVDSQTNISRYLDVSLLMLLSVNNYRERKLGLSDSHEQHEGYQDDLLDVLRDMLLLVRPKHVRLF